VYTYVPLSCPSLCLEGRTEERGQVQACLLHVMLLSAVGYATEIYIHRQSDQGYKTRRPVSPPPSLHTCLNLSPCPTLRPHLCRGVAPSVERVDAAVHRLLTHEGLGRAADGAEEMKEVARAAPSGLDTRFDPRLNATYHLLILLLLCLTLCSPLRLSVFLCTA
jgi:hypothetical protein